MAAVSLLLFLSTALYGGPRGLTAYCLSLAIWATTLLLAAVPETAEVARRLASSGAFVVAGFLHAAYALTGQRRMGLVWFAYAVAATLTLIGVAWPGMLYDPVSLAAGPFFGWGMALAASAAALPLIHLWRAGGALRRRLALSGLLCDLGAWANATLLANGEAAPWGLYAVLASVLLLGGVVTRQQDATTRRLVERSVLYLGLTALLTGGVVFGVLRLVTDRSDATAGVGLGALFVVVLVALLFEPARQALQRRLAAHLLPNRVDAPRLAAALGAAEARADQAERLAELGTLASAVAHEVRNPLGVLKAHLGLLERGVSDAETLSDMRDQIHRAERFVEDLLRYGRPRPLTLRMVELRPLVDLAWATARQGLGATPPPVTLINEVETGDTVEVDQAQIADALVVLFENAHWALEGARPAEVRVRFAAGTLSVHDTGPGVPAALRERLFEPFVTGRGREGRRAGTGLGLSIARRAVERHGGSLELDPHAPGACFHLKLPRHLPLPGIEDRP